MTHDPFENDPDALGRRHEATLSRFWKCPDANPARGATLLGLAQRLAAVLSPGIELTSEQVSFHGEYRPVTYGEDRYYAQLEARLPGARLRLELVDHVHIGEVQLDAAGPRAWIEAITPLVDALEAERRI